MNSLPEEFVTQMKNQLGSEYDEFVEALHREAPVSIRINRYKPIPVQPDWQPVTWSAGLGYYLPERPVFTLDPVFQGGGYYVQEASSMAVGAAYRQLLGDKSDAKVLDLCAAPGGKTTDLLNEMGPDAWLVANEVIRNRYQILRHNLAKWGTANIAITNHDAGDFSRLLSFFDMVVVDAPCSGEGLFRKDLNARKEWSEGQVEVCAKRTHEILEDVMECVKPGGYLIFSTCTYNDTENAISTNSILKTKEFDSVKIDVLENDDQVVRKSNGYQFYPHRTQGEGFFIAVFQRKASTTIPEYPFVIPKKRGIAFKNIERINRKKLTILTHWIKNPEALAFFSAPGDTVIAFPKERIEDYWQIDQVLNRKHFGLNIGTFKRDDFIPSAELALSHWLNEEVKSVTIDRATAIQFLRRENIVLPGQSEGWRLVKYEGINLGWVKVLKNRINNYFPKNWRILMR